MTSRPKYGKSRAMVSRKATSYLNFGKTENPLYYYVGFRGALIKNCNLPENIPKVDGFCSLHLKNEWDIDRIFYAIHHRHRRDQHSAAPPLLDFLGISQMSASDNIFDWQERKTFLPLATAGQRPIFASDAAMLEKLNSVDFDPRHTVYLPMSAQNQVTVTNGSQVKISSKNLARNTAQLAVEASAPALVVIAQSFYHNWHAYVDGQPVPLLRANHAFQALQVPAGQHTITLHYEDWMFRLGATISALTLLGCLTSLLMKPRR